MSSAQIGAYGRGRASGHRQPSMGRDNLINAFAPPPFPLHKRISSSLALYLSLRRSKRAGICRVLHSRRLVCATAGPRGFGKTGSSSSDVPPLRGCDPHHAKVFRMEAGGRGSVHNVTHASSGV